MSVSSDIHIKSKTPLTPPVDIFNEYPLTPKMGKTVQEGRNQVREILNGNPSTRRLMVICGPCSIHNPQEALEYANKLKQLQTQVESRLLIIMRSYFEKPRTTVGWKGLLYDPDLNGSYNFEKGIRTARKLLMDLSDLGVYCATEILDPIITQYIADCIAYAAIGARTTESQPHREFVSGLSMPTGFKNATNGDVQVAIDAVLAAACPHSFLGVLENGHTGVFRTTGNSDCHVILRGGNRSPNFASEWIAFISEKLRKAGVPENLVVDCSHSNSGKVAKNQMTVLADLTRQLQEGNRSIAGVMIESNLCEGCQKVEPGRLLLPGVSITDSCIGWEDTETSVFRLYDALSPRFL